jgi:hypothetical protein
MSALPQFVTKTYQIDHGKRCFSLRKMVESAVMDDTMIMVVLFAGAPLIVDVGLSAK